MGEEFDEIEKKKKTLAYLEHYASRMKELLGDFIGESMN